MTLSAPWLRGRGEDVVRYGHIAMSHWSSLPQGEEVLSFALQDENGNITQEPLLESPGEWERKGWVGTVIRNLAQTPTPTTIFFNHTIEDLLFEIVNFDPILDLNHVEFLSQHQFRSPTHAPNITPLTDAVETILSEASALLASRKRSLKALQIARGDVRWVEAFTDGSFMHEQNQGGAAFLRDDGAYGALRFQAENSNETEFVAALIAISSARGGEKVSINSDSRHVVRALNNLIALAVGNPEPYPTSRTLSGLEEATLDALAEVISPGEVRAHWVRGHCGNKMNDGADRLAKAMRKRSGRPTVKSVRGIARAATGIGAPVSYGFTTIDLAVPDWYSDYLKNGDVNDVEDACEGQFGSPSWTGTGSGDEWLVRRASA